MPSGVVFSIFLRARPPDVGPRPHHPPRHQQLGPSAQQLVEGNQMTCAASSCVARLFVPSVLCRVVCCRRWLACFGVLVCVCVCGWVLSRPLRVVSVGWFVGSISLPGKSVCWLVGLEPPFLFVLRRAFASLLFPSLFHLHEGDESRSDRHSFSSQKLWCCIARASSP